MEPAALRAQFPVLRETAYLNAGTCGPLAQAAVHAAATVARAAVDEGRASTRLERLLDIRSELREAYAQRLRARPQDVALTTVDLRRGRARRRRPRPGRRRRDRHLDTEHPGLYGPLIAARARGVTVREVPLADVRDAVGPRTRLVACSHVDWTNGATRARPDAASTCPCCSTAPRASARSTSTSRRSAARSTPALGPEVAVRAGGHRDALGLRPRWRERLAPLTPGYLNLAEPGAGLDAEPWPDARAYDAPASRWRRGRRRSRRTRCSPQFGWPEVHERARPAGRAASPTPLRERGPHRRPARRDHAGHAGRRRRRELPARLADAGHRRAQPPGHAVRARLGRRVERRVRPRAAARRSSGG